MGSRIRDMVLLRTGERIDPARDYTVAGWASVNDGTEGPPIWTVVEGYLAHHQVVRPADRDTVRIPE